jgi:hypothetical protein
MSTYKPSEVSLDTYLIPHSPFNLSFHLAIHPLLHYLYSLVYTSSSLTLADL